MELDEVLTRVTEHLVSRLRSELSSGAGLEPRTRDWLLLVDATGVAFIDFDEPYDDAGAVLQALIQPADVELAALVTQHSRSELLLAAHFRRDGKIVSFCRRSHLVPPTSKRDPPTTARWEPI